MKKLAENEWVVTVSVKERGKLKGEMKKIVIIDHASATFRIN